MAAGGHFGLDDNVSQKLSRWQGNCDAADDDAADDDAAAVAAALLTKT